MSTRVVWGQYTRELKTGLRIRYKEKKEEISNPVNFNFNMTDGQQYQIGSSYYFSTSSGYYSLSGLTTYTYKQRSGIRRGSGYILSTSGAMYYSQNWYEHASYAGLYAGSNIDSYSAYKYTSESYQEQYTYYAQGSFLSYISSANSDTYPSDDYVGGYWYIKQGTDNIDADAVIMPSNIEGGTSVMITVMPSTKIKYGGVISYLYQYKFDDGPWTTLSTSNTTQFSLAIPKGTKKVQARVRANDNIGFTSSDYTTSEIYDVVTGDPPYINWEYSSNPYDVGQVTEPFSVEYTVMDPDYGDTINVAEMVDDIENDEDAIVAKTYENVQSGTKLECNLLEQDNVFQIVPNEKETYIKIAAVDSNGLSSSLYKVIFTKYIDEVYITLSPSLSIDGFISRGIIYLNGYIPNDADFSIEVTNNANDESPTWQDVTLDVLAGRIFYFVNSRADSGGAFNFKLHVKRGTSNEGGFIDTILGAFG